MFYLYTYYTVLKIKLAHILSMAKKKQKIEEKEEQQQQKWEQNNVQQRGQCQEAGLFEVQSMAQFDQEKQNVEILHLMGQYVVNQANDALRLTWQAMYSLKNRQMELNKKMMQQINAAKDKNELQIQQLYNKISKVTLGTDKQQLLDQIITNKQLSSIPNYWKKVLTQSGILNQDIEEDTDCIAKMQSFSCIKSETNMDLLTISIKFREQPKYFKNRELSIEIMYDNQDQEHIISNKHKIQYKILRRPQSLFTQLFDSEDKLKCASFAREIYQIYCNSIYFYFSTYYSRQQSPVKSEKNHFISSLSGKQNDNHYTNRRQSQTPNRKKQKNNINNSA